MSDWKFVETGIAKCIFYNLVLILGFQSCFYDICLKMDTDICLINLNVCQIVAEYAKL